MNKEDLGRKERVCTPYFYTSVVEEAVRIEEKVHAELWTEKIFK